MCVVRTRVRGVLCLLTAICYSSTQGLPSGEMCWFGKRVEVSKFPGRSVACACAFAHVFGECVGTEGIQSQECSAW